MAGKALRNIPDIRTCDDCGERVFWNHCCYSGGGRTSHGLGKDACEKAHDFRHGDGMLDHREQMVQALVEIGELCGRAMSEMDDDEWGNVELLQKIVVDSYALASDGIRTPRREGATGV